MKYLIFVLIIVLIYGCANTTQTTVNGSRLEIKYYRLNKTPLPSMDSYIKTYADTCSFPPSLVQKVKPSYLPIAIRAGVEGDVVVRIFVNSDGQVYKSQIVRSDAELFNKDAIDATMQWKFTPFIENCVKTEFIAEFPICFRLSNRYPNIIIP